MLAPDRLKVKLRWTVNTLYTLNAGGYAIANITANSPYDPDGSGSANIQLTGWDQYSALYNEFLCSGAAIKAEFTNCNNDLAGAADPTISDVYFGVIPSYRNPLTTSDLSAGSPGEQPYCKEVVVPPYPGPNRKRIKHYMSTKKIYGRAGTKYDEGYYGLTGNIGTGSNPTHLWYWNIYAIAPAGAAAASKKYRVRFTVTYYVIFSGRKFINIS